MNRVKFHAICNNNDDDRNNNNNGGGLSVGVGISMIVIIMML